jgi:PAS domain S-box-containing protein
MKMNPSQKIKTVTVLLLVIFGVSMWRMELKQAALNQQRLVEDADVIALSLWNYDRQGPQQYLRLAARLNGYEHVSVYSNDARAPFFDMHLLESGPLDTALIRIGLIPRKTLSVPIWHENEIIGRLKVIHLHKTVYTYLYWVLVTGLAWFGAKYFIQMLHGRTILETRVQERTRELWESKENMRITLLSIGDAVIAADEKGLITDINAAAAALTGWQAEEAIGQPLGDVFSLVQSDTRQKINVLLKRVPVAQIAPELPTHALLISRAGMEFEITETTAPIRNAAGVIIGVVIVFRDVTAELALQERLKQTDQMRVIGQLAGGIAHDFNNMLGAIIGAADLMRDHIPTHSAPGDLLDLLVAAADNAADLANKLLLFGRKQTPESKQVAMHRMLQDTVSLLSKTLDRQIRLSTDFAAAEDLILGDSSMLQGVFMNLGINASHAIEGTGEISFKTRIVEFDSGRSAQSAAQLEPGRYLEISVSDTGGGIDPENLSRIFEPFFTTKSKGMGTGLGLSTAFTTIQQHHGEISVSSEPGVGTCFVINLPLAARVAAATESAPSVPVPGRGTILLIDDDELIRETGRSILETLGYRVRLAADGREGLAEFERHQDEVDLVMLDMVMPEMNGRDCFFAMQNLKPSVRVILASGFLSEERLQEMQQKGLTGYLKKPFHRDNLSRVISKALRGDRQASCGLGKEIW